MARQMLRYSLPVVPSNLCSLIVNASDRFFVKGYLSIADAGIYALGYKLGNVVFYLVRSPFMQIWSPRSFALYREGAPPEVFARIATYFNAVMVFVGLGVAVYVKDVIKLISAPPYWGAAQYAPAVTLCYIIYALDNLVAFGISAKKRTEYWTMVNLVASGVNIVGNFVLISRFGIWGAVWSTGISITVKVGLLYIVGRHFFSIPFEWPRMAVIMGVAAALYALSRQIVLPGLAAALLVDTVLIAAFLPAMWLLGLVRRDEKQQVARYAGRVWRSLRWVEAASK
jgi:O-antigen/teichoic acid export membrane protein